MDKKIIILLCIILLAVFLRTFTLVPYDSMMGSDGYFHGRIVGDVITNNEIPTIDSAVYEAQPIQPVTFYWSINVTIYKFIFGEEYSQDNIILLMKIMPVIWGILAIIFTFLFVRNIYGTNSALIAVFIMAIIPAFMHRTMFGFFEDDSIIFFLVAIMLWFISWKDEFLLKIMLAFFVFINMITIWVIGYFLVLIGGISIIFKFINNKKPKIFNPKYLYILLFFVLSIFILIPSLTSDTLFVGEENVGIPYFAEVFNVLLIFPIIALITIPFKKVENSNIFIWLMTLSFLFLAFYKLKYTFLFSFPIALCAGFVFKEFKDYRKIFIAILIIALPFSVVFAFSEAPPIAEKYLPAMEYLDSIEGDCYLFNWWNEGHWITFYTTAMVWMDNRNHPSQKKQLYADFVLGKKDCTNIREHGFTHMMFPKDLFEDNDKTKLLLIYSRGTEQKGDYSCLEEIYQDDVAILYKVNFE